MRILLVTSISRMTAPGSGARMSAFASKTSIPSASPTLWRGVSRAHATVLLINLCVVLSLTGASPALGQQVVTDLKSMGLTGAVRAIKESVEYPRLKGEGTSRVTIVYKFNRDGTLSEHGAFGERQPVLVYVYNSGGSSNESAPHPSSQASIIKREVKSDREGKRLQFSEYCGDGFLIYTEKYKYRADGLVELSKYDHFGDQLGVQRLKYESGRLSEIAGPRAYLETRNYYDNGQPKEIKIYTDSHELSREDVYSYKFDEFGNWIERYTRRRTGEQGKVAESNFVDYRAITYYPADPQSTGEGKTTGLRPSTDSPGEEQLPPTVVRKSGVLQGSAWRRVEPAYPFAARNSHITGQVIVEVTIDECGRVTSSKALSGPSELRESAEHAARGWLFGPTRLYEVPVKVIGTITFNFQM